MARVEQRIAEENLREYFQHAERAAGYRSIHGALIDSKAGAPKRSKGGAWMAQGHSNAHTPRSPEDGWSPERCQLVRRCGRVAKALAKLQPAEQAVLAAVYAVDESYWRTYADATFDQGIGIKLERVFGDLVGVAILCAEVPASWHAPERTITQAHVHHESDAELRARLIFTGATRLERRRLRIWLRAVSGSDLEQAAWWFGREREHATRLPRDLPAAKLRLDAHGAGGWLVAQLAGSGKTDLAPIVRAAEWAHAGALGGFCRAASLGDPEVRGESAEARRRSTKARRGAEHVQRVLL